MAAADTTNYAATAAMNAAQPGFGADARIMMITS
jgi:hypothetical protein